MSEHRYDKNIGKLCSSESVNGRKTGPRQQFPCLQTRERCAVEIAAYVFKYTNSGAMVHRRLVYIYLLNVPSFSSRYFNKIKRMCRLGRLLALSLEILRTDHVI